ncbi:MAG: hypothetical protein QOJ19_2439 [Acidimicrobiia bacterium]|nr:hypothetical protein [Acidimicrobiia bacterium]
MVLLAPVRAWVVEQSWASTVVGYAYDGLRPEQRRQVADSNPDSFFNVVRSVNDYGDDPVPEDLQAANARSLQRLLRGGRYVSSGRRALYLYRLRSAGHEQIAVVGDVPVAAFLNGEVRAHERTREAKELELARHLSDVRMSSSPVGLTYRGEALVDELVEKGSAGPPLVDFTSSDGVRQAVWELSAPVAREVIQAFTRVAAAYIVDGHHRVAAAARVGDEHFLAGLVPANQLNLAAYHRVVAGPLPVEPAEVVDRLAARPSDEPVLAPGRGQVGLYLAGRWYRAGLQLPDQDTLDVEAAAAQVLGPLAGVTDPRVDPRLDFVPGTASAALIQQLADRREGLALTLHPPSVNQLLAEADAGRTLPPKSTWFEPKLHSGVFVVQRRPLMQPTAGAQALEG